MPSISNCQSYDQSNLRNYINSFNKDTVEFIKKTANENKEDKSLTFLKFVNASCFAAVIFITKPKSFAPIALSVSYNTIIPITSICVATAFIGHTIFKNAIKFKNHCEDADTATRFINDMNLYQKSELLPEDIELVEQAVYVAKIKQQISERSKTAVCKYIALQALGGLSASLFGYTVFNEGHGYDLSSKVIKMFCGLNLADSVWDHTTNNNARDAKHLRNITKVFKANLQAL